MHEFLFYPAVAVPCLYYGNKSFEPVTTPVGSIIKRSIYKRAKINLSKGYFCKLERLRAQMVLYFIICNNIRYKQLYELTYGILQAMQTFLIHLAVDDHTMNEMITALHCREWVLYNTNTVNMQALT